MDPSAGSDAELVARVRQQEVVADLGQRALEIDDLDRFARETCAALAETLDVAYAGAFEVLPDGERALLRHGEGWREGVAGEETVRIDRDGHTGRALESTRPVVATDLPSDDRDLGSDVLADHGVVSAIAVAVGSAEDPWGVLGVYATEHREFTDHDANFVQSVANVLASAIESEETRRALEEIYGRISDAFMALDESWEFTYLNDRAHEVINPEGRELIGENVWEAFPAATERAFKPQYERAMYRQETVSFEEYYPEPLDAWFEVRAYPSETGLSIYFRDVTERKRRERAREESERRYRTLAECFPNGVVTLFDDDLTYTLAAGRAFEELPVAPEEIEDRTPAAWGDDVAEDLEAAMRGALAGREESIELSYVGRDWIVHAVPVADEEGEVFAGMTMAQDITERTDRERRLERYGEYVDDVLDAIGDVFYVLDEDGSLVRWNESLTDLTGYVDEEIASMHALEFFPDDARAAATEAIAECFETGSAIVELPVVAKDGETIPVEFDASTLEDPWGNTILAGIGRDMTERVERQRALAASEQRYRTLAENFPNGAVAVYDPDLTYTLAEGSLLGGRLPSADRMEGEPMPELFPEETVADLEPLFRAAVEDGETGSVTTEVGGRHWRVWAAPLYDADGEIYAGLSFTQNITEQVERQRRLEASNERLEQFAYAASHDLQEPLRMVSSYLRLIEERYADDLDADGREFLAFAVDGADRMREMIDGLLQYSRVDTRGDPLEPVDLDAVVADAIENLQVKIDEHDAELSVQALPRVVGDESQLAQVFQNLLDNAIEYGGHAPTVQVAAARRGDVWELSIHDEGIGIDPDDAERVFEVFQRLHTHDDHPGTGIGLALCQRIVERHGGEIWLDSEPGEGTTVSFTLPAAPDRES